MIHFAIKDNLNSWNLTVVYGSPHPQFRIELWRDLKKIASEIRGAWSLIADFNAVLADNERQGGSLTSCHRGDNAFRELVRECNLINMGYQGNPFTWRRGMLYEQLYRVLMNLEWQLTFPQADVFHLNLMKSDHCPLLLKFDTSWQASRCRRPFRFEAAWLTHPDFSNQIRSN
uniref:Endonuclease/exonuclease/phosphatase domain-containing protein n=2 Tax=Cajanus cajan TaxID=3821 RepID=A0A151S7V9_CAJCA|nr:hypothetical protein KK1_027334 [Cajanus cajan]